MSEPVAFDEFVIRANRVDGEVIDCVTQWETLAPPRSSNQWRDFRSAKELAQSCFREGLAQTPQEYLELLNSLNETRGFRPTVAYAEAEIDFDEFSGPRNSDLVVLGDSNRGKVCVAVEAKADEEFAKLIDKELQGLSRKSNKRERVKRLSAAVFQRRVDKKVKCLRYQLLHALAATAIEARKHKARLGVLLIHEFISLTLDFANVSGNAYDLQNFIKMVPGWENRRLEIGKLLPPIRLKGNQHIPSNQRVTIGKVRTLLPLDTLSRRRPDPGFDNRSKQYLHDGS